MCLEKYLGEEKMELLKREVELSAGIQLKIPLHWLISKDQLRQAQITGNE